MKAINKLIYYANLALIFVLIPVKIIDFSMSLEYIGTNDIFEANPFGYIFLNNPLMFIALLGVISICFIFANVVIYKRFPKLNLFLTFVLILSNLIGIYVLLNNFNVLLEVYNS